MSGRPSLPSQRTVAEGSELATQDQGATVDDITAARVDEVFKRHDKDADGSLEMHELKKAIQALVPKSTLPVDVKRYFDLLDKGGDGLLSKQELMTFVGGPDQVQKNFAEAIRTTADTSRMKKIRVLFRMYDKTDDGYLNMGEMRKLLKGLGPNFTSDEIDAMEADIDKIKDGKVSIDEFMEWVSSSSDIARELRHVIDRTQGGVRTARIKATFQKYDRSGDGNLEIEELSMALKTLGCFTTMEVQKICTDLDKNKDGSVSYKEFAVWVSSGAGGKEITKAKAILAPSDGDGSEAVFYNFCGPGHLEMDHGAYIKMCRDCQFIDDKLFEDEADLIFHKLKTRHSQRIELEHFEEVRDLLAEKRGEDLESVYEALIKVWKPKVDLHNVTQIKAFKLASEPLGRTNSTPRTPGRQGKPRDGMTPRKYTGSTRLPAIKGLPKKVDNSELYKVFGMNSPAGRALLRAYPPKESPRLYVPSSARPTVRTDQNWRQSDQPSDPQV